MIAAGGTASELVLVSLSFCVVLDSGVVNQTNSDNKKSSVVCAVKELDTEETFSAVVWFFVPNHGFKLTQKILAPRNDLVIILYFYIHIFFAKFKFSSLKLNESVKKESLPSFFI